MELQIALDRMPTAAALKLVAQLAPLVDWLEVGTSMIKRDGAAFIRDVVAAAGATPVLADLKTADDARWEFSMAYDAGARSATVLGLAPGATIDAAVAVAAERGLEVVVDLMGLDGTARRSLADRLPPEVVLAAHVSKDTQRTLASPLEQLGQWAEGRTVAIAGGLTAADLPALAGRNLRVIIGSAVTAHPDPLRAIADLLAAAGRPIEGMVQR
jgi:3-hexulose-6-phosphate synthase